MSHPHLQRHRLETVRELAEGEEQQAARKLAKIQALLNTQQAELQQLQTYQQDYSWQLLDKGKRGHSAHMLAEHSQFVYQVYDICEARRLQILDLQRRRDKARQDWQQCNSHHQAINKIIQRDLQLQQQKQRQQEQDTLDEIAQRSRLVRL